MPRTVLERWRAGGLAALAALLLLALLPAPQASAVTPTPTKITIDSVTSGVVAPTGTPASAVPSIIAKAGDPLTVTVSFSAAGLPASFNQDTKLSVTATTPSGTVPTAPATAVAPRNATTATFTTSLTATANQVTLRVAVAGGKLATTVAPGTSVTFDVVKTYLFRTSSNAGGAFQGGIGGSDGSCTEATAQDPVCGVAVLPLGVAGTVTDNVLLSQGACDTTYAGCATTAGSVVQVLANLGSLYGPTTPASVIMKCDKTLCGTGAIQSKTLRYSLAGNDALAPAPACPDKNTIGAGQEVCVDYVQSKRDGSGDTWLFLLLTRDVRVSYP